MIEGESSNTISRSRCRMREKETCCKTRKTRHEPDSLLSPFNEKSAWFLRFLLSFGFERRWRAGAFALTRMHACMLVGLHLFSVSFLLFPEARQRDRERERESGNRRSRTWEEKTRIDADPCSLSLWGRQSRRLLTSFFLPDFAPKDRERERKQVLA